MGHTPSTGGTFRKKFPKSSGKTPETLSERFLEFPSRVRLQCPKPYNSRHLRLPERFQNSLPPSTAGDASFFRIGSGEGLSELLMEFPAVLGVFLSKGGEPLSLTPFWLSAISVRCHQPSEDPMSSPLSAEEEDGPIEGSKNEEAATEATDASNTTSPLSLSVLHKTTLKIQRIRKDKERCFSINWGYARKRRKSSREVVEKSARNFSYESCLQGRKRAESCFESTVPKKRTC